MQSMVMIFLVFGVSVQADVIVLDCFRGEVSYSCLVEKTANALERTLNWDIPVIDGVTLKRNGEVVNASAEGRSAHGVQRLKSVIGRFLQSHTLSIDLSRQLGSGDGFKDGTHGMKVSKKERKYFHYTMMVLLGIFGLSAPLIMKTLALIAGKALIASKIALLMVGSVALKKIFQSDGGDSGVKVHTHTIPIHEDEHDRYMDASEYSFHNANGAGQGI
ncbi:PREDICTED: uncharacterized protein LOC108569121 [Nicrophorus vespilloides]|uniref:Uncharacterized protein LOC108569121 n=1 Tax=Nicrophorus vespilloides TaxID=110193 RepID=A0ABM1NGT4_NICVS|nr:PREDICTED: uncharacterized protein LOC108569121 [Nicrophorus vespilloides]